MDISLVIQQLRAYCPVLGGRIGGAADFDKGVETVIAITDPLTKQFVYPVAVVIPLEDEPGSNDILDGNLQVVTETIGIIVEFDATADRRGQGAASQVEAMKYSLFAAVLSWVIDPNRGARGLFYAGGELLDFDRARLFWMFRFSFEATISDADGFVPRGDPLTNVTQTMPPDAPINLAPPIVAEETAEGQPAVWGDFVWGDGSEWQ